jgi:hypothetical protein
MQFIIDSSQQASCFNASRSSFPTREAQEYIDLTSSPIKTTTKPNCRSSHGGPRITQSPATPTSNRSELGEECVICLCDLSFPHAKLDSSECIHRFHSHCIQQWAKVTNLCPLCKRNFKKIILVQNPAQLAEMEQQQRNNIKGKPKGLDNIIPVRARNQRVLYEAKDFQREDEKKQSLQPSTRSVRAARRHADPRDNNGRGRAAENEAADDEAEEQWALAESTRMAQLQASAFENEDFDLFNAQDGLEDYHIADENTRRPRARRARNTDINNNSNYNENSAENNTTDNTKSQPKAPGKGRKKRPSEETQSKLSDTRLNSSIAPDNKLRWIKSSKTGKWSRARGNQGDIDNFIEQNLKLMQLQMKERRISGQSFTNPFALPELNNHQSKTQHLSNCEGKTATSASNETSSLLQARAAVNSLSSKIESFQNNKLLRNNSSSHTNNNNHGINSCSTPSTLSVLTAVSTDNPPQVNLYSAIADRISDTSDDDDSSSSSASDSDIEAISHHNKENVNSNESASCDLMSRLLSRSGTDTMLTGLIHSLTKHDNITSSNSNNDNRPALKVKN